MIYDLARDIDAAQRLHGMKFHRVIDLIDDQTAFRMFDQVYGEHSAAHRFRGAQAQLFDFRRYRTKLAFPAARGVRDPMLGLAVHRREHVFSNHDHAYIAPGLFDVFLNIKDGMLHRPKRGFMFKHGLRGVSIIDFCQQSSP